MTFKLLLKIGKGFRLCKNHVNIRVKSGWNALVKSTFHIPHISVSKTLCFVWDLLKCVDVPLAGVQP